MLITDHVRLYASLSEIGAALYATLTDLVAYLTDVSCIEAFRDDIEALANSLFPYCADGVVDLNSLLQDWRDYYNEQLAAQWKAP